jgi:hypothetical protein
MKRKFSLKTVFLLIQAFGIEKFQQYLKAYINNPAGYKDLFLEIVTIDLDEILVAFHSNLGKIE